MAGFDARGRLLVLSHSGYGIVDPVSLETVDRDSDFDTTAALSLERLTFRVPSSGETVSVFGLWGGDGAHMTADAWRVEVICPWWPRSRAILRRPVGPGVTAYFDGASVIHDFDGSPVWTGFSPDGRHLALVESSAVGFLSRP
jgi:hypothetical protein